jgi:UDP-glucose 4-epimerase
LTDPITRSAPRVLVTGGSGAIGRHVVAAMLAEGWDVVALAHTNSVSAPSAGPGNFLVRPGDVTDADAMASAISEVDVVCHLAAYIPSNFQDAGEAEKCLTVNAIGTLHAAMAAARHGKRLISCSSGQAYAFSPSPVSEDGRLYPAARATYYLTSKIAGELYVEQLRKTAGLQAITFRVGSAYGPGTPAGSVVSQFMLAGLNGEPIELYNGGVLSSDLVYVTDISRLIIAAVRGGDCGVYNAGSGVATSARALAEAIREVFSEREIEIRIRPPGPNLPASFSALSMAKTNTMWRHEPTPLAVGLRKFRAYLEERS